LPDFIVVQLTVLFRLLDGVFGIEDPDPFVFPRGAERAGAPAARRAIARLDDRGE
jgi:hypothetical protein